MIKLLRKKVVTLCSRPFALLSVSRGETFVKEQTAATLNVMPYLERIETYRIQVRLSVFFL